MNRAIVSNDVVIGNNCIIEEDCIIAAGKTIPPNTHLEKGEVFE